MKPESKWSRIRHGLDANLTLLAALGNLYGTAGQWPPPERITRSGAGTRGTFMRRIVLVAQIAAFLVMLGPTAGAQTFESVEFFTDSIIEKRDSHIRLLGGSSWLLSEPSLALVTGDVLIVFRTVVLRDGTRAKVATAYFDGEEIDVRRVGGAYATQTGYLTRVVKTHAGGAVLELANGTLLSVPEYDRFYTGWWLPPYKALLTGSKLHLYNLEKMKRVWVSPL